MSLYLALAPQFDLFQKDVVLVPVNHNNAHWTAAAINFKKKRIESYDSMGMDRSGVYKVRASLAHPLLHLEPHIATSAQILREYLNAEHKSKKQKEFDFSGWTDHVLDVREREGLFAPGEGLKELAGEDTAVVAVFLLWSFLSQSVNT